MKNASVFLLLLFTLSLIAFTSCNDDEDVNEQESITTVRLAFKGGPIDLGFKSTDLDGVGGNAPITDTIILDKETVYLLWVSFLDESGGSTVELTGEIREEDNEHLICYEFSNHLMIEIGVSDQDKNGDPLGLLAAMKTNGPGTGTLKVTMKHLPDKAAASPCETGETDVEATFDVVIQ